MGWGSSLLDKATGSSPQHVTRELALRSRLWEAPLRKTNQGHHQEQPRHDGRAQLAERRNHPRLAHSAEISIQQLSPRLERAARVVSAEVQNLSRGGICIGSRVPLMTASVVQCQIGVPDLQFAIPTLMQVVWIEKLDKPGASQYTVGLRYLL